MAEDRDIHGPSRTVHNTLCECGGEGLLPETVHDHRGEPYTVWHKCPDTTRRLPINPGPRIGWTEYVERNPQWFDMPPDGTDLQWCRQAARAIIAGGVALRPGNPLGTEVDAYIAEYHHRDDE